MTGENTQLNASDGASQNPQQPVKFDRAFTPKVDEYIELCKKENKKPTVKGFATYIGTDLFSINAWAYKKKKDEQGNVIDQWARPNFLAAIQKLEALEKNEEKPKEEIKLNPKQELFCQIYATSREHFGNATQSYAMAYGIDIENKENNASARASASALLTNLNILARIDELLGDLKDEIVDQELAFVIRQRYDLPSKIAGIREYNKTKGRIVDKLDVTSKGKAIKHVVGFNYLPPAKQNGTDNTNTQANS